MGMSINWPLRSAKARQPTPHSRSTGVPQGLCPPQNHKAFGFERRVPALVDDACRCRTGVFVLVCSPLQLASPHLPAPGRVVLVASRRVPVDPTHINKSTCRLELLRPHTVTEGCILGSGELVGNVAAGEPILCAQSRPWSTTTDWRAKRENLQVSSLCSLGIRHGPFRRCGPLFSFVLGQQLNKTRSLSREC